jgi:hypothetical protein
LPEILWFDAIADANGQAQVSQAGGDFRALLESAHGLTLRIEHSRVFSEQHLQIGLRRISFARPGCDDDPDAILDRFGE